MDQYQKEISEQLANTEQFLETLLTEKENNEIEFNQQITQARLEKSRAEEELGRIAKNYQAMR
jgi:hypothetical protein